MKRMAFVTLLLLLTGAVLGNQGQYRLNEEKVDALFDQATEVNFASFTDMGNNAVQSPDDMITISDEKEPLIAWLFTYVPLPGTHRLYLGTKTTTFVGYVITIGGCLIVQGIDWIVLLIGVMEDDISDYVDNPSFFMW